MSAPVLLWRIGADTAAYTADDRSGRGAELSGGRWNRTGTPMRYASTSRALACLETMVHLSGGLPLPLNRYLVELTVPGELWGARTVFDASAHVGWDAEPAGMVSMDWGVRWAATGASALAEVPSAVVPEETNVLIDPRHESAGRIRVRKLRRWLYDPRLGAHGGAAAVT